MSLQVVDQFLEGLLDDGGADFLVFVRLVRGNILGGFDGLGQFTLGLADCGLQRFNLVGLGLEELSDEIVVGDERVMPAD